MKIRFLEASDMFRMSSAKLAVIVPIKYYPKNSLIVRDTIYYKLDKATYEFLFNYFAKHYTWDAE